MIARAAVTGLLVQMYRQSTGAQVRRAQVIVSRDFDRSRDRYDKLFRVQR
jgi:hypothetical protein